MKISSKRGGPLTKSISVYTNIEGADATVRLKLKGTVWEPVQANPRSAAFGRLAVGAADTDKGVKTITITNNVEGKLKLTNIKSSNPAFAYEVKEIEPGQKVELTVKIAGELKPGLNRADIDMDTGVAEMPKLKITASAHLTPEVEIQPKQITVYPDRKTARPYTVIVRNNGKSPLEVTDVAVNIPELKAMLIEKKPGQMYSISLTIPSEYELTGKERVTFNTNIASFAKMTIPVVEKKSNTQPAANRGTRVDTSKLDVKRKEGPVNVKTLSVREAAATKAQNEKGARKDVGEADVKATDAGKTSNSTGKKHTVAPGIKKATGSISPTANKDGTPAKQSDDGEKAEKEDSASAGEAKKPEAGDK